MAVIYWPFDTSLITEGYGYADWRKTPQNPTGLHNGIDFGVPQGTQLLATASGTIRNVDAGQADGAGVDIITPDGWKVRHWHVSKFLVTNNSWVNAGDVIALSGGAPGTWGAGFSTGPHLHWGTMVGGAWVDPASLSPQTFGTSPVDKKQRENKMNLCHVPQPDGTLKFVLFNDSFYLEFVGQEAANAFASQIGGNSAGVSQSFLDLIKAQVAKNQGK